VLVNKKEHNRAFFLVAVSIEVMLYWEWCNVAYWMATDVFGGFFGNLQYFGGSRLH
jgi:hypothetical protein